METTEQLGVGPDPASQEGVRVGGAEPFTVPPSVAAAARQVGDVETRTVEFRCLSGRCIRRTWRGVPLPTVIDHPAMSGATTHVRLEAADGHTVCIDVRAAGTALLGLTTVDTADAAEPTGVPRVVGPDIDGPRAIKRVVSIDPLAMPPSDDPAAIEQFEPGAAVTSADQTSVDR